MFKLDVIISDNQLEPYDELPEVVNGSTIKCEGTMNYKFLTLDR